MKQLFLFFFAVWLASSVVTPSLAEPLKHQAVLLDIQDAIGPATKDFVERGLQIAVKQQANVIILRLDTPGGLDQSMRSIIKNMLSSPIPVVGYVAPSGARAASAGTFILYASQIAAMAPGTNLGAATPVGLGGSNATSSQIPAEPQQTKQPSQKNQSTLKRKITNDAIAYIRSLAELRGRNVEWAEKAVSEASSISAQEALHLKVIDLIASDAFELLQKINGRQVNVLGRPFLLKTENLTVQTLQPDWRTKFLSIITNPNVAYFLILIGIYGLIFEFANPGFVLPGVAGAISLLLALYALQLLPISYAALSLILLGVAFMVAEAFVPSFGALGIGGLIAFVAGSIMLMDVDVPGYQIGRELIIAMTIITIAYLSLVLHLAIASRRRRVVTGREELLNQAAVVKEDFKKHHGWVQIHGELWKAQSNQPLKSGQIVKVIKIEGLTLFVDTE